MGMINFFFEDTKQVDFKRRKLKENIHFLLKNEGFICQEINIILCTDEYLLALNERFLKHDYYTDIITFDNSQGNLITGELYISLDRVKENAVKFNVKFVMELYRVITHGVLHLAGFKDKSSLEKQLMTEKEDYYLSILQKSI